MPGDLIGPNYRGARNDGLSLSSRRELRRADELHKLGEIHAFYDKSSTKRFINDAVEIVGHARRVADGDQALLAILAPIVENWLNREHANMEYRNVRRML